MPKSKTQETNKNEGSTRSRSKENTSSAERVTSEANPVTTGISGSYGALIGGDYSQGTFEKHAALLGSERLLHPANTSVRVDFVRRLQSDYGNTYVQRLVDQVRRNRTEAKQPQSQDSMSDVIQRLQDSPLDYQSDGGEMNHPWEALLPDRGGMSRRSTVDVIQRSLTVGAAGDKYEQEADKVAKQVMSGGETSLQKQEEEEELQMKPAEGEEDEVQMMPIQRASDVGLEGGDLDAEDTQAIDRAKGKGQSLDDEIGRASCRERV